MNRTNLTLGVILIIIGALFLLGQFFDFLNWDSLWPFIVIGVGAAFFVGMIVGGKPASGLAIPGSILSMIGLILFFQNTFNLWESWSYAWALIIVAVGIGIMISGKWGEHPDQVKSGWDLTKLGLILFLVFGALMNFVFNVSGVTQPRSSLIFAIILAVLGLALLISRIVGLIRQPEQVSKTDLFWPVIFLGAGILWALVSLNWLSVNQVVSLLNLWPVLLIAIGLFLLLGRRNAWVGGLIGLLFVATMFLGAIFAKPLGLTDRLAIALPSIELGDSFIFGERIKGSGNVVTETRPVSGFNQIELSTIGDAEVVQGDTESLTVEADDNVLPYIITEVQGNRLKIYVKSGIILSGAHSIHYKISVKDLVAMDVSGAATVKVGTLNTSRMSFNVSGAGNLFFDNLQAGSMSGELSGGSTLTAAGKVEDLKLEVSGAGSFKGQDLECKTAKVEASGGATATVWVTEDLDVNASGGATVAYYGSPSVSKDTSGGARLVPHGNK
jgi:hypothetical protein